MDSGNYLRCVQGAVTTGRFFFTLIEVRRLPDTDAVLLLCHGVGPLGLGPGNELTEGRPRIAVAGTASQPQRFWLKPTGEGYALLLKRQGHDLEEFAQEVEGTRSMMAEATSRMNKMLKRKDKGRLCTIVVLTFVLILLCYLVFT